MGVSDYLCLAAAAWGNVPTPPSAVCGFPISTILRRGVLLSEWNVSCGGEHPDHPVKSRQWVSFFAFWTERPVTVSVFLDIGSFAIVSHLRVADAAYYFIFKVQKKSQHKRYLHYPRRDNVVISVLALDELYYSEYWIFGFKVHSLSL